MYYDQKIKYPQIKVFPLLKYFIHLHLCPLSILLPIYHLKIKSREFSKQALYKKFGLENAIHLKKNGNIELSDQFWTLNEKNISMLIYKNCLVFAALFPDSQYPSTRVFLSVNREFVCYFA